MDLSVISHVHVVSCATSHFAWQNLTLDITRTPFIQIFVMLAMLIGTTDFYHLIPFSVTSTLAEGHEVSVKQNLLASFSSTLFDWQDEIWCGVKSNSSWTSWYFFWMRVFLCCCCCCCLHQGSNCCFTDCIKKPYNWHALRSLWTNWFKLGVMMVTTKSNILILVWVTLTLIQGHRIKERKNICASYHTKFSIGLGGVWYAVETCWCEELQLSLPHRLIPNGENSAYVISFRKKEINTGLCLDSCRLISFKLAVMTETTVLYIFKPVWVTMIFM